MITNLLSIQKRSLLELNSQSRPAAEAMLSNAEKIAEGKAEYETYESVFSTVE